MEHRVRHPFSWGLRLVTGVVLLAAVAMRLRRWLLRAGTRPDEADGELPGDDRLGAADLVATRAITIHAPRERVWPWVIQIGQGRGGFYSYEVLENLVGSNIHNATR